MQEDSPRVCPCAHIVSHGITRVAYPAHFKLVSINRGRDTDIDFSEAFLDITTLIDTSVAASSHRSVHKLPEQQMMTL